MPICCSNGRSVAREAQMQPSETSMKLQMLSGTMVSADCARASSVNAGVSAGFCNRCLQVRSSEIEKSRMYLKRTKVAIQALLKLWSATIDAYIEARA